MPRPMTVGLTRWADHRRSFVPPFTLFWSLLEAGTPVVILIFFKWGILVLGSRR